MTSKKRIGVFGGSFDPIHHGHLLLAQDVFEKLQLSDVMFVPAYRPPHKKASSLLDVRHRCKMVQRAVAPYQGFHFSDIEIKRRGTSYTYETLETIKDIDPRSQIYILMGDDNYRSFGSWKHVDRILGLARIVVFFRGGRVMTEPVLSSRSLQKVLKNKTIFLKNRLIDISSTEIRQRVTHGLPITSMVPDRVARYIRENNLYSFEAGII